MAVLSQSPGLWYRPSARVCLPQSQGPEVDLPREDAAHRLGVSDKSFDSDLFSLAHMDTAAVLLSLEAQLPSHWG